jgi:hypothetical protein
MEEEPMSKISVTLTKTEWQAVEGEIIDYYGLDLNPKQMKDALSDNSELMVSVAQDVYTDDGGGITDTDTRERIVNHISLALVKDNWPTGATRTKVKEAFFDKFARACKRKGYLFDRGDY